MASAKPRSWVVGWAFRNGNERVVSRQRSELQGRARPNRAALSHGVSILAAGIQPGQILEFGEKGAQAF